MQIILSNLREIVMKDEILEKYNIPILRLATNGSGEEERLKNKLIQVLDI